MKFNIEKTLSYSILFISMIFVGFGVYRNEDSMVLKKAINICLECIGIG